MRLTARALNRATLARQLLLDRAQLGVDEAVRRVAALQAQQPESTYLAMWSRIAGFDPAELDGAFDQRRVVKATLMRITMHAVHADDYEAFHAALQPTLRGSRLADPRFTSTGLTTADFDALVPELVDYAAEPRTVAEIEAWLADRLGSRLQGPPRGAWWALRSSAPLHHVPTGPPWGFGPRPRFVAAGTTSVLGDRERADAALTHLVRRYLEAFGPASVADVAQFALVPRGRAQAAVDALDLERLEGPGGEVLHDVPEGVRPPHDIPAPPRLLPMWDSLLLAHADRTRVIAPEHRRVVIHRNGDVLPSLLVDGRVAGVWRVVDDRVEATAFDRLSAPKWAALTAEAEALLAFLAGRDLRIYSRFHHWWAKVPELGAGARVLAG